MLNYDHFLNERVVMRSTSKHMFPYVLLIEMGSFNLSAGFSKIWELWIVS